MFFFFFFFFFFLKKQIKSRWVVIGRPRIAGLYAYMGICGISVEYDRSIYYRFLHALF